MHAALPSVPQRLGWAEVIPRLAMLVLLAALSGCAIHSYSYRYRLTLVVNDNGALYRGSSVVGVRTWEEPSMQGGTLVETESIGQATVVDLGRGRLLVGLLSGNSVAPPVYPYEPQWGDGPTSLLQEAYGLKVDWPRDGEPNIPILMQQRGAKELAPEKLPTLAALHDSRNPTTAVAVDPRNLEAVFGPGVHLQSATIEITQDHLTTGITERLPWLIGMRTLLDGRQYGTPLNPGFRADQFRMGVR